MAKRKRATTTLENLRFRWGSYRFVRGAKVITVYRKRYQGLDDLLFHLYQEFDTWKTVYMKTNAMLLALRKYEG